MKVSNPRTERPWPTTMRLFEIHSEHFGWEVYRGEVCVRSGAGYTEKSKAEVGGLTFIRKTYGTLMAEKVWQELRQEEEAEMPELEDDIIF